MISDRDLHEGPEESREKRTCPALKSKYYSSMLRKHSSVRDDKDNDNDDDNNNNNNNNKSNDYRGKCFK